MRPSRTVTALLCLLLLAAPAAAQEPPAAAAQGDDPVAAGIDRGVTYLLERQDDRGSFAPGARYSVALTSLSVTALLSAGHLPTDDSPEGRAIAAGLDFVLRPEHQRGDGYFGDADAGRMYGHGITTLMLSEVLGMTGDADTDALVRTKLEAAVDLILRSQQVAKYDSRFDGGWRYAPESRDADLSITVWQTMALRSAAEAGVEVPAASIERATAYLKRSFQSRPGQPGGRFAYQPQSSAAGYSQTAAGLLALQVCGVYDAPEVEAAVRYLRELDVTPRERWFFYGTYYYAQGMSQRRGEVADEARRTVADLLIPMQNDDGSWNGTGQASDRTYATSLAVLSLTVRYHYLPIYQR